MSLLLDQIEWSEPILPAVSDPAWEAETKRRLGRVGEVDRRVAANPWLRELCVAVPTYRPSQVPPRLLNIAGLVTAQENACRYCYGANRAYMKMMGYSESFIQQIERDADLAELDPRDSAVIAFCRNLARSKPRPAKNALEQLVQRGHSPVMVRELAFMIAAMCFYNRIGVLTASPPERAFERFANGPLGRAAALVTPFVRGFTDWTWRAKAAAIDEDPAVADGPFGRVVATLHGLPCLAILKSGLDDAFASPVLSRAAKALMFAIVGRTLDCRFSEAEGRRLLEAHGFAPSDIDSALATLSSPHLQSGEAELLAWVRDTVHYQTPAIQRRTRAMVGAIGPRAALEAVGVAALANATVRLARLLE